MLYFLKDLIYLLPSAFLLFWIREIFRTWIFSYFSLNKSNRIIRRSLLHVDPISISLMSFGGLGWGGILTKNRKDSFNTFVLSQIVYLIIFFSVYIYFRLNNTQQNTYIFQLLSSMAMMSYTLFFLNWIPLPPFDFSFWYMQTKLDIAPFQFILILAKIIVILFFFVTSFNKDFLFYNNVLYFLIES